jgi:D-glycero-alpha-D-manno-heptose-7-phosphate kinase
MIITRTPFRISFFGGGTDYPKWYLKSGGQVLSTTIDKYCYISCRLLPPFFEHKHRIVYSKIENVCDISSIEHPAVRGVFNWANVVDGLEIHHDGDLPARSGLGSSSSFTVGLIHAIEGLKGRMISKESLAKYALHVEQNVLLENVGSQDQIAAAFGGFNRIKFNMDGTFSVSPVTITSHRLHELQSHLMLFFTGFSRIADSIAKSKLENFKNKTAELILMSQMVDQAISILQNPKISINEFGELLHSSWALKRSLSHKVSTPEIDDIYEAGISAGATGGKILGAGGGGFMLFFADPARHRAIREKLNRLVHVDFQFENLGSCVALYQPNGL